MATNFIAPTISLRLEGDDLSAQVFHQKIGKFLDLLHAVDRNVTEELDQPPPTATSIRWVVESVRSESPITLTLRAEPIVDNVLPVVGERIVRTVTSGLAELESTTPVRELPHYFDFTVLEELRDLVRPVHDGLTGVVVSTPEQSIPLTPQTTANMDRFLRPVFEHIGSVEGMLQMVSVAGGTPRFSIRDRISGRAIRCTVPRERLPEILRVFDRRVIVFGRVRTNEQGDVLSVQVEDVEAFPHEADLPTIEHVAGAFDLTGGKSISEHLDWLRDAS